MTPEDEAAGQEQIAREYQEATARERGQRDGVVVTPVEVVDFMNQAVRDLLSTHFGTTVSDRRVKVLDPFAGTGIFPARLIQTTRPEDVPGLVDGLEAWELDPDAAEVAQDNLNHVAGTAGVEPPRVRVVDTFTVGEEPPPPSDTQVAAFLADLGRDISTETPDEQARIVDTTRALLMDQWRKQ